jgi:hypothetical protein
MLRHGQARWRSLAHAIDNPLWPPWIPHGGSATDLAPGRSYAMPIQRGCHLITLDPGRTLVLHHGPGPHPTGRLPAVTGHRIDYLTPMNCIALQTIDWWDWIPLRTRRSPPKVPCLPSETGMIIESELAIEAIDWWDSSSAPAPRPLSPPPHTNANTSSRVSGPPATNELAADPPTRPSSPPAPRTMTVVHRRRCHARPPKPK